MWHQKLRKKKWRRSTVSTTIEIVWDCLSVVVRSQWSLNPRSSPSLFEGLSVSCSTFRTRYTYNLIMSYIQGKSLHGLMWRSVRARAFALRLWETERLQGEASRNVRTRTDSQKKKKRREVGVGRRRTEVNINLRGPKESLPAARLDAHLFRAIWSEQQDPGKQY